MVKCKAITKKGKHCKKEAVKNSKYCGTHKGTRSKSNMMDWEYIKKSSNNSNMMDWE